MLTSGRLRGTYSFGFHAFRKSGSIHLVASLSLLNSIPALSYGSLPSKRVATAPNTSHSVQGPAMLKLEQAAGTPLQARTQPRRPKATRHKDYRQMSDMQGKEIDAVAIGTPKRRPPAAFRRRSAARKIGYRT